MQKGKKTIKIYISTCTNQKINGKSTLAWDSGLTVKKL